MGKILLDDKGYQEYLEQIEAIRKKIKENAKDIATFASDDAYGDGWHDNFAYEEATKKESSLYQELDEKLKGLNDIEIINGEIKKDVVSIGAIVRIKYDDDDGIEEYHITGNAISNINDDLSSITINSPLGRALFNKKANDNFLYEVDGNKFSGKIISIEYN
jgi:transcription elongation GreA/GreB family factor